MTEVHSDTSVTGTITPIQNGTRVRLMPTTYSTVRSTQNAGAVVRIDLVRTYIQSDDPNIHVGDKWGRVIEINNAPVPQPSWMAIDYHGTIICTKQYTVIGEQPPVEPPVAVYPDALQVSPIVGGVTYPAKTYIPE